LRTPGARADLAQLLTLARLHPAGNIGASLLLFRVTAADQAHVVFMPDTTWASQWAPARGSSQDRQNVPVSMSPKLFRHFSNDSLALVFLIPT
jgi:hypothetical protein